MDIAESRRTGMLNSPGAKAEDITLLLLRETAPSTLPPHVFWPVQTRQGARRIQQGGSGKEGSGSARLPLN